MNILQKTTDIKTFVNILPGRWTMASMDQSRFIVAYDDFGNKLKVATGVMNKAEPRLAYILPASAGNEELLQGLSLFNEFDGEVIVYCSRSLCDFGEQFSNDHISFQEIGEEEISITADAVVTYSLQAIYFIKQLMPVLILGPCGIGGWITPGNLPFLASTGFMGRPGGSQGEIVPFMIWIEEVREFTMSDRTSLILEENKKFVDSLPYIGSSEVRVEIARRETFSLKERDAHLYWELPPRYCSNVARFNTDDAVYFKRRDINDTIAGLPISSLNLLDGINGEQTTADIFSRVELNREEFIELFDALIESGVITFLK